jgi:hypothetical protein
MLILCATEVLYIQKCMSQLELPSPIRPIFGSADLLIGLIGILGDRTKKLCNGSRWSKQSKDEQS